MNEQNLRFTKSVDREDFAPILIIDDVSTNESWRVRFEDLEDQKAFLGDKFSMEEFLKTFGSKGDSWTKSRGILNTLKEYYNLNGLEEYKKLLDQIYNLKVEEIK